MGAFSLIVVINLLNRSFCEQHKLVKMVNVPKARKTFCPACKVHQNFKVTQYKKGLAAGSGKEAIRPQAAWIRWSDQTCVPKEGQDHQKDRAEAPVHEV